MQRVTRGLSIRNTCLLSMFQAIVISPSTSWLAKFKNKSMRYIIHSFFFTWFLNLFVSSYLIFSTVASSNVTQTNVLSISKCCSLSFTKCIIWRLFFMQSLFRDVSFVGITLLSSAYMVILLFRHQRRPQHLHSSILSPKTCPEKKATQTILLPVSFFVVMYWVDLSISSSSMLLSAYGPVILGFQRLVVNVHATVSPLVLLSSDKTIINMMQMWHKCRRFLVNL